MVGQVLVVLHLPTEGRRILLVEKELDTFLAAAHEGCAHLVLELYGFRRELGFPLVDRRLQVIQAILAEGALPLEVFEIQSLLGDLHLGVLQFGGHPVALTGALVHALFEFADLLPDLLQLSLLDLGEPRIGRLSGGLTQEGEYAQKARQISETKAHMRQFSAVVDRRHACRMALL